METSNSKNNLDDLLFNELNKINPSEIIILELIENGANINCNDRYGENLLQITVENCGQGLDLKYIQLLLDLKIDLSHTVDGFNCLFEAMLTYNIEISRMLLNAGMNPNCISTDTNESLLDYSISKLDFMEQTEDPSIPQMKQFIELIKSYGAKSAFNNS